MVIRYDGQVIRDPTLPDLARAIGVNVKNDTDRAELAIVGQHARKQSARDTAPPIVRLHEHTLAPGVSRRRDTAYPSDRTIAVHRGILPHRRRIGLTGERR